MLASRLRFSAAHRAELKSRKANEVLRVTFSIGYELRRQKILEELFRRAGIPILHMEHQSDAGLFLVVTQAKASQYPKSWPHGITVFKTEKGLT